MKTLNEWEEIGEMRGMAKLIILQIRQALGGVPDDIRDRLNAMNSDRLQSLGEVLLDLSSYAEVRAWLDANTQ